MVFTFRNEVVPPAFVVRLVSVDALPTAPENVVAPVLFAVSPNVPSTVLLNVIAPLPVLTVLLPARAVVPPMLNTLFAVVYVPFKVTLSP